jgi:hypothetical protein
MSIHPRPKRMPDKFAERYPIRTDEDGNDVEPSVDRVQIASPKIIQGGIQDLPLFKRRHGIFGPPMLSGGPCFHFNETEYITIPGDHINLPMNRPEISGYDHVPLMFQKYERGSFPSAAQSEAVEWVRIGIVFETKNPTSCGAPGADYCCPHCLENVSHDPWAR